VKEPVSVRSNCGIGVGVRAWLKIKRIRQLATAKVS
jgi:hypothetical protein